MFNFLLGKLLYYIKPQKSKIIGSIILSIFLAAISGLQVSLIKPLFDRGLKVDAPLSEPLYLAGSLLLLGFISFPCRFYHFYWLRCITDSATYKLREELFKKVLNLPFGFFQKSKHGKIISNIVNDTVIYAQGFKSIIDMIREPLKALVFLGMALWADWQLTTIIIILGPLVIYIFSFSGKKVRLNQRNVQVSHGNFTSIINECLSSNKILKAFNLQKFTYKKLTLAQDKLLSSQLKTAFVEEITHPLVELIGVIAFAGIILFSYFRIHSGNTTLGEFISFLTAFAMFMDPVRKLSHANIRISQARASNDNILKVLELPDEKNPGDKIINNFKNNIEIKNLTFSYGKNNEEVINNLSLTIKKGEKVALVGLSGSGKSTLVSLLLGLYNIEQGDIFIDGVSIKNLTLNSLRNLFGLVSQDVFLFHDTIRNNLVLGRDSISESELNEAIDISYCREFISRLSNGLDTVIGERGTFLSGGQQQRLTIARALLQNTDILLFDEATSALDNESEKMVQKSLEHLASDKTVIAVAHRLSTIQNFDKIFVMHDGELVEEGTHSELIERGGNYSTLYELSLKL